MMLLAPPRLSIKNCWPIARQLAPSERARMSTAPPAEADDNSHRFDWILLRHTAVEPTASAYGGMRECALKLCASQNIVSRWR
jgi:hypothetical protein